MSGIFKGINNRIKKTDKFIKKHGLKHIVSVKSSIPKYVSISSEAKKYRAQSLEDIGRLKVETLPSGRLTNQRDKWLKKISQKEEQVKKLDKIIDDYQRDINCFPKKD